MSSPRRPVAPRPRGRGASRRPPAPRASSARPASRASGASATGSTGRLPRRTEEEHQPPPRMISVRSVVLLLVVAFSFSLVVPTVRSFLAQRAQVAALEQQVEAARQRDAELKAERARWDDPAYVASQARERLAFVKPGEIAYRVVDPEVVARRAAAEPEETPEPDTLAGILAPATDKPWFTSIWESVQVAGGAAPDQGGEDEGAKDDDGAAQAAAEEDEDE